MKITIKFADGMRGVYNEDGDVFGVYEGRTKLFGEDDGLPYNRGVWDDTIKETKPWKVIVKELKSGTYKLPKKPYLDNGQVTEEGLIKKISIK